MTNDTKSVERFNNYGVNYAIMRSPHGKYVLYNDYKALAAENEHLQTRVAELEARPVRVKHLTDDVMAHTRSFIIDASRGCWSPSKTAVRRILSALEPAQDRYREGFNAGIEAAAEITAQRAREHDTEGPDGFIATRSDLVHYYRDLAAAIRARVEDDLIS